MDYRSLLFRIPADARYRHFRSKAFHSLPTRLIPETLRFLQHYNSNTVPRRANELDHILLVILDDRPISEVVENLRDCRQEVAEWGLLSGFETEFDGIHPHDLALDLAALHDPQIAMARDHAAFLIMRPDLPGDIMAEIVPGRVGALNTSLGLGTMDSLPRIPTISDFRTFWIGTVEVPRMNRAPNTGSNSRRGATEDDHDSATILSEYVSPSEQLVGLNDSPPPPDPATHRGRRRDRVAPVQRRT